ncbi:LOW QUALITY PROTEIN: dynein light chain roadblock-type 1 [Lethenteron reissneri]|uniref:LOW QUALITY PROTEIN: dynein light chain roadblock-type 1 n=1 Tax=Lethenteron reissneri TaxID=7753 RepID=UPI002AB704A0|nr:LOW QUALITY PROTEIN: dynein light chain roadblock-type 1 [Lethenteron reissneri]
MGRLVSLVLRVQCRECNLFARTLRVATKGVVCFVLGCSCDKATMSEVEETLKRIQTHKGVIGTIVVNAEGIPIRTTLDNSTTVQYAGLIHQLTMKARSTVRDIDPQNDLTFLRVRSKKHEIMVAPDKEYLLIVIQNPSE